MSGVDNVHVECTGCGFVFLDGKVEKHPQEHKSCPNCGSFAQHIGLTISDSVSVSDYVRGEARRLDSRHKGNRADHDFEEGTRHGGDGRLVYKKNVRDREHPHSDGSYQELVIDVKTGEVIVDKHERLSDHR